MLCQQCGLKCEDIEGFLGLKWGLCCSSRCYILARGAKCQEEAKRVGKVCQQCGKGYKGRNRMFCDMRCYRDSLNVY